MTVKAGAGEFFVMSALAKLGATVLTYPILLVKQRLQAASKHTHADLKYAGTYDAVTTIWQKEGLGHDACVGLLLSEHASADALIWRLATDDTLLCVCNCMVHMHCVYTAQIA